MCLINEKTSKQSSGFFCRANNFNNLFDRSVKLKIYSCLIRCGSSVRKAYTARLNRTNRREYLRRVHSSSCGIASKKRKF